MTNLATFDFEGNTVRTAGTLEAPLFCAADVCAVLGIAKTAQACERLDQDDVHEVAQKQHNPCSTGTGRPALYVNESGLYTLILTSNRPQAKAFKKWVTSEVLPEIRKRGYYSLVEHQVRRAREQILAECFPNLPAPAAPMFSELIEALLRRFGWAPASKRKIERRKGVPPWAPWLAQWSYDLGIRIEGQQAKRRELNPDRTSGTPDHSMFSDRTREAVRDVLKTGVHFARISVSWDDWKHKMELCFGTKALQMPLMVPMLLPPDDEDAA